MNRWIIFPALITFVILPFDLPAQVLNPGFEDWTGGEANNWTSNNISPTAVPVTQSGDSYSGASALRIETVEFFGGPYSGTLQSGTLFDPYFDVAMDHEEMTGYYKHFPMDPANERVGITVTFFDASFGLVANGSDTLSDRDTYTHFSVPLDYSQGNGNPAVHARVTISFAVESGTPKIGSYFLVDDLAFEGVVSSVQEIAAGGIPAHFELSQNYPNPFNPTTTFQFSLAEAADVRLAVYSLLGEEAARIVDERLGPGSYSSHWDAGNLPSGTYFYRLEAGSQVETRRLMLLK